MNARRRFILAFGASVLAPAAFAQQQKIRRVAYLSQDANRGNPVFQAFSRALLELGWIDGKNIEVLFRATGGRDALYPQIVADIVRENVDVIVTTGSPSTRAAIKATSHIPIVFGSSANPVEQKFVSSLAKPGGNVTGLALVDLGPKRLELLKQLLPRVKRIARLYDAKSIAAVQSAIIQKEDEAAKRLGVTVQHVTVEQVEAIEAVFGDLARNRIEAMHVSAAALFVVNRALVSNLALQHNLPLVGPDYRFVEAGSLASYGENFPALYRRAAYYVDKILRGMKPADIPVEEPTTFDTVLNLRVAAKLGIKVPESVLLQATRLIE